MLRVSSIFHGIGPRFYEGDTALRTSERIAFSVSCCFAGCRHQTNPNPIPCSPSRALATCSGRLSFTSRNEQTEIASTGLAALGHLQNRIYSCKTRLRCGSSKGPVRMMTRMSQNPSTSQPSRTPLLLRLRATSSTGYTKSLRWVARQVPLE